MKPLVWAIHRATVAGANITTVQDVLNREIDVNTLRTAGDLDAVAEGRDGAMRPARSTVPSEGQDQRQACERLRGKGSMRSSVSFYFGVLWDVLIARHGAVIDAVLVAPREGLGESLVAKRLMRKRRASGVSTPDNASCLRLLLAPDLGGARVRRGGRV